MKSTEDNEFLVNRLNKVRNIAIELAELCQNVVGTIPDKSTKNFKAEFKRLSHDLLKITE